MRYVEDHTQWRRTATELGFDSGSAAIIKNLQMINGRQSIVPLTFAGLIGFGKANSTDGATADTPLLRYFDSLTVLRRVIENTPQPPSLANLVLLGEMANEAAKDVEAVLQPLDEHARTILRPRLINPLRIPGTRLNSPR